METVGDLLRDVSLRSPDERVENAEFLRLLQTKLKAFGATLRRREAQIFRQRLLSDEPLTMKEMAGKFGVSRERARQVEEATQAEASCLFAGRDGRRRRLAAD